MKIFVSGGGTGGHLFPAIALGEELVERGYDVHLITDTRCKGYIKDCKLKTHILHLGFMRASIISKILLSVRMIFGISRSISLLICYRPQLVVCFGGYTSFPVLVAAKLLHIPIMLHEQNCFLGKVNEMFARSSARLVLNFAETTNLPSGIENKIVVAGNPVRKEFREGVLLKAYKKHLITDSIRILVTGGSQSAKVFSDIVPSVLRIVHIKNPELKITITQQAAPDLHDNLRKVYEEIGVTAEIEEFFYDMPKLYAESDLVICRSGASTIAELIHTGKPALMIPFPFAAEDHQTFNARVLEAKGAGWAFAQSELTPEILADKIIELAGNPSELSKVSRRLLELRLPSERILGDTVKKIING